MRLKQTTQISTLLVATFFTLQACTPPQHTSVDANKPEPADVVAEQAIGKGKLERKEIRESTAVPEHDSSLIQTLPATTVMMDREAAPATANNIAGRAMVSKMALTSQIAAPPSFYPPPQAAPDFNTESYTPHRENSFILTSNDPLSTFSIDVDTGSYANVRRFLTQGSKVPIGAVRIEEMLNYFHYDYPQPTSAPLSITTELGPCPWQPGHSIARIGIKGKELAADKIPPSNLVFLVDVSGSMNQAEKLPLVKQSLKMLTRELKSSDRISMVVYAGSNHVVLPPTPGNETDVIIAAIDNLASGGSTHGSAGITSAYKLAHQGFIPEGNNRVILASDGDFNVGITSRGELEKLIETEREKGVFLTVLGFGSGNYKDDTMELLADKGNGNYSYIDSLLEAKKVLVKERASTLYTIAKDVKLQIEFNPAYVGAYRLLGYENRALADEDFRDDKKDAGEVGAGHTVTALYELIPPTGEDLPDVARLKYQQRTAESSAQGEILTVSLRYKDPDGASSKQLSQPLQFVEPSAYTPSGDLGFATSVAWFAMVLKESKYLEKPDFNQLLTLARNSRGSDEDGLRAEFIKLVETAELLDQQ